MTLLKPQKYLDKLLDEIKIAKEQHRNGIFKMREKLTDETALYAKKYLETNTHYRVDFHKCPACAFEWDIIIIF